MINAKAIAARRWARAEWWRAAGAALEMRAAAGSPGAARMLAAWRKAEVASVKEIARLMVCGRTDISRRWAALGLPTPPSGAPVRVADLPADPPDPGAVEKVQRQRWRQSGR